MNIKTTHSPKGYRVNIESEGMMDLLLMIGTLRKSPVHECQAIAVKLTHSLVNPEYVVLS